MDSTGEQLHPNWRALTTVHLPMKRFVKAGTAALAKGNKADDKKYEIQVNGEEAKEFYEKVTNNAKKSEAQTKRRVAEVPERQLSKQQIKKEPKLHFEKEKYFRYAMTNNVEELQKFDYSNQNINACDAFGWTALMMAACEGAVEAVIFLLKMGVDGDLKDRSGKTALDLAKQRSHMHLVDILQNGSCKGANNDEQKTEDMAAIQINTEPFYCASCKRTFTETTQRQHQTSTLHQFNYKSTIPPNKLEKFNITPKNRGVQLMLKQGWDRESGLGPTQGGRLYPVKTVIRKYRTGLGIEQPAARVTHFEAFDLRATKRNNEKFSRKKKRSANDIKSEKIREWKRDRRLRNELS